MSLTEAEREQRLAQDDGDLDDEVVITRGAWYSTSAVYHQPGCRYAPEMPEDRRVVARGEAQRRGQAPCRDCVLEPENRNKQSRTCPFCGEVVSVLPRHLVDCEAATADAASGGGR